MADVVRVIRKGWVWFYNAPKAHYIVEGRSLCGKWMYLGSDYDDTKHESPDNCKACARKRAALEAQNQKAKAA